MWFYENLGTITGALFATGPTLHFLVRSQERHRYRALRQAYEDAIREARDSNGEPAAVVREAALHRAFMNSWLPGWFEGFGRCLRRSLKVCAAFTLLALFLKGPIERGEEEYARKQAGAAGAKERIAGTAAPRR